MKYVAILVVLAALGGGYLWMKNAKLASAGAANVPDTRLVVRRDMEKLISANGKVASNRDVDIKCQASGKVIKLPVDISDRVKLGDLLVELDPVDQKRSLDQAKAQVDASTARVSQAKTNYDVAVLNVETSRQRAEADVALAQAKAADSANKLKRVQELFNSKLASQEELETAQTSKAQTDASVMTARAALSEIEQQKKSLETKQQDIATATAQLAQDQAKFELQQTQLGYTKVFVPDDDLSKTADYRVSKLTVQVGTVVQSGSSGLNGGTTVMTLSDLSHIYVLASVDESEIGKVSDPQTAPVHQKAHITVDSFPTTQFEGEVVRVAPLGVNSSNVVTFEVKIEVTSENKALLKPEMTATVKVVQDTRPSALVIPTSAFNRGEKSSNATPATATAAVAGDDQATRMVSTATPQGAGVAGAATGPVQPTTRGGRGGRGGRGRGGATDPNKDVPQDGMVMVLENGAEKQREVTVGMSDGENYEVIAGLQEGEEVVLNKSSSDSRWSGRGQGQNVSLRGIPGGGGGGRR